MSRLPVLVPLSLVSALTLGGLAEMSDPGESERTAASSAVPDSAIEEYQAGRFWHAARILEAEDALDAEGRLWLARAQAGYRHWEGVLAALDGISPEAAAVFGTPSGELWSLRALALDESGRDVEADAAWARALDLGLDASSVAWARRARIALAAMPGEGAPDAETRAAVVGAVDSVVARSPLLAAAVAAEAVEGRAEAGDTATFRMLLERAVAPFTPSDAWALEPTVLMEAGDSARGEAAWERLLEPQEGAARRGRAHEALGDIARARGDDDSAAEHYLTALRLAPGTAAGRRAARGVVDLRLDDLDSETAHAAARALDRLGDGRRALAAYDRYMVAVVAEGVEPDPAARVERARIAVTVPSRQEEAIEEFRALDQHPDPAIGVRALTVWAGVRQRQGQTGNYQTLRSWLIERYPDSDPAAEIVFLRADAAQDRGALDTAIGIYEQVAEMAPSRTLAGQARMRVAQIHLGRGDLTACR